MSSDSCGQLVNDRYVDGCSQFKDNNGLIEIVIMFIYFDDVFVVNSLQYVDFTVYVFYALTHSSGRLSFANKLSGQLSAGVSVHASLHCCKLTTETQDRQTLEMGREIYIYR